MTQYKTSGCSPAVLIKEEDLQMPVWALPLHYALSIMVEPLTFQLGFANDKTHQESLYYQWDKTKDNCRTNMIFISENGLHSINLLTGK